jgi:hypothetical protein
MDTKSATPTQAQPQDVVPTTPRFPVPEGQTPLNDTLGHRFLDVLNEGAAARATGKASPYHGHSLEHCLHAFGWVSRDLRLALDATKTQVSPGAQDTSPWCPISSAPIGDVSACIDIWSGDEDRRVTDCFWDRDLKAWAVEIYTDRGEYRTIRVQNPTHWMPAPLKPEVW